jgi:hypothetical protein
MNTASTWLPAEDGATIGHTGPEGGEIWKDEEHPDGARVTLERDALLGAPFALTAAVYGWLVQTLFYADEPTALQQFEAIKPQLAAIAALVVAERSAEAADAVDRFTAQYA